MDPAVRLGQGTLTAWLAGPPAVRAEPELLLPLVDALLALLRPYAVRSAWTSEPRTYRLGARGRALLADAISAGRIASLALESDRARPSVATVRCFVNLGMVPVLGGPVTLGLRAEPGATAEYATIAASLAAFVRDWFVRLDAAAAFVSDRAEDYSEQTAWERDRARGAVTTWAGVRRHARGAFWGMGLGPGLCAPLGGPDRVAQEAPVPEARRLGRGVWIQAAATPPADRLTMEQLTTYLMPLLRWSSADLLAEQEEERRMSLRSTSAAVARRVPPGLPIAPNPATAPARQRRLVPLRVLQAIETDVGLNVYVARPPSPEQQATVTAAVDAWYDLGVQGAFGTADQAGFLHDLTGPSIDVERAVMRWLVDLGSADDRQALLALRERLASLPGVEVTHLVVGTEQAR